jgi:nucleolar protein 4
LQITEEQLRQHFIHYGEIRDMCLLRRSDGKLVGCGFVEYANKEDAKKAIAATSGKPLLSKSN